MKTKGFLLMMLMVLVGLSITVANVQAASLDFSGGIQFEDGGGDEPIEPAEFFPATRCTEGDGGQQPEPAE